jgi:acyl carrier protein
MEINMKYTLESIENSVKTIIAKTLRVDASTFGPDTHLIDELGADSLDALSIAMDVDDQFGINVSDNEIKQFKSCREISSAVFRHMQEHTVSA